MRKWLTGFLTLLLFGLAGCSSANQNASTSAAQHKYKIYLDLSYSGNAWQSEAANVVKALAKTPPFNKEVDLTEVISGTNPQSQISDIQSMVAKGANGILIYPISGTALNGAIAQACASGVLVFAYDGTVTAPCAYNVEYLTSGFGENSAQFLVNALHGHGNIFLSRGVAGTTTDLRHYEGAMAVFSRYPGIHIVDQYYGNWDDVITQQETAKALAAHPNVQGIWAQAGEDGAVKAVLAAGLNHLPVITGENSNGFRLALGNTSLNKRGLIGVSAGSPPAQSGYAFKLMMELLTKQLKSIPHEIQYPLPWVPYNQVQVCSGTTFVNGCDVFPSKLVPDSFVTEIFQPQLLPEISIPSALQGTATPGQRIHTIPVSLIKEAPPDPGIDCLAGSDYYAGFNHIKKACVAPKDLYKIYEVQPIPVPSN